MRSKTLAVVVWVAVAFTAGCGGDDETTTESGPQGGLAGETAPTTGSTPSTPSDPPQAAKLFDGENFNPNDIADCLLDADVGAGVSLDGVSIDLHDAQSQVIVEQGNADVLVYDDEDSAKAAEADYRASFGDSSEVGQIRNVLWQADPDVAPEAKSAVKGCLGV
jgi:hypothetical protein